jgi:hypothetical protein
MRVFLKRLRRGYKHDPQIGAFTGWVLRPALSTENALFTCFSPLLRGPDVVQLPPMPTTPHVSHPPLRIALVQLIDEQGFVAVCPLGMLRDVGARSSVRGLRASSMLELQC